MGLLAGFAATPAWDLVLQAIYQTKFGIVDPIFSRDIGFYVFTLPALSTAIGLLTTLVMLCLLLLIPLYWLRGDVVLGPRAAHGRAGRRAALGHPDRGAVPPHRLRLWQVEIPSLLYSTTGPLVGASYTDVHARLPALRVTAVLAVLVAIAVLIGAAWRQVALYGALAIGGYVAVAFIGRGLFPLAIQKFVVAPTELTRETPYLRHHIVATRQAWGLDSVETRELGGGARSHAGRHPGQRARPSRTCGSGTGTRCC